MSVKTDRLASTVQKELQAILARGLHDPRIRGLVTVTRTEIVDEGRIARAYISVLPEDKAELTMHGLNDATPHLRRELMKLVRVRTMPRLELRYDEQARRQAGVLRAIAETGVSEAADAGDETSGGAREPGHDEGAEGEHGRV